ncbi:hypothetical protein Tco_0078271 [Tanacetum coccineum]
MRKTRSVTVSDRQYFVFNGTEYAVLIFLNEYVILDRKLDTPYPMKVDTPYRFINQNSGLEYGQYGVSKFLDTPYQGFLGVGTMFDIFQNILFPYGLNTVYCLLLDTAYWILFPSYSLNIKVILHSNHSDDGNPTSANIIQALWQVTFIMEYLVNISKRRAFWSLNKDNLKINDSDNQYAIYIKEDTAYPCLHSPKTTKERRSIRLRMTKVIKGEFEKIKDVKVEDVSLTCDTSLEVFNNEVNRLSGMDDDLFTYEVEVANIPCDSKMNDDSEHEADDDMGYDPSDVAFTEWLGSKFFNYKTMDHYIMKALWIYWIRGDDEVELTDEESFDDKDEVAEVFRIDTNLFNFETPMCKAFKEFNYLLQIDPYFLTKDIEGPIRRI